MPRPKQAKNCNILPWLSGKTDCREGRFIQIGNSLFFSEGFQNLSEGAKIVYLCMALESGGKSTFTFPAKTMKKYGLSVRTTRRHIDSLIVSGFIERESGKVTREENRFTFTPSTWKTKPP